MSGGFVDDSFNAHSGSVINISGGSVGEFFQANRGSVVNISGGSVSFGFNAGAESVVNISGGRLTARLKRGFTAESTSEINISGGTIDDRFLAEDGSVVNLIGSDFVLDGILLDDLIAGESLTIVDRDVTLSGLLTDGSAFSFDLNSASNIASQDVFEAGSTLTVTLTPDLQLGDCNQDGFVNFSDIAPFISVLASDGYLAEADTNEDGAVTFDDISPFIVLLSL